MDDANLLQAIRQIVKEEVEPIKSDVSSLKDGQESLKQDVTDIKVTLENDVDKRLSALLDGHKLNTERIEHISDTVDDIDALFTATDISLLMQIPRKSIG